MYLQGQDLATGNLTAPAVYALQTAVGPELDRLIKGGFSEDETGTNLQQALHLVAISGGIDRSRELARQEADMVGPPLGLVIFAVMCGWHQMAGL